MPWQRTGDESRRAIASATGGASHGRTASSSEQRSTRSRRRKCSPHAGAGRDPGMTVTHDGFDSCAHTLNTEPQAANPRSRPRLEEEHLRLRRDGARTPADLSRSPASSIRRTGVRGWHIGAFAAQRASRALPWLNDRPGCRLHAIRLASRIGETGVCNIRLQFVRKRPM